MEVPFARPCFTGQESAAVAEVIASGWVSQGPRVREFEQAFADRVGAPEAVATTSCTTALHLALYASGVGPGDEVIVPSLSFIATANAVWQCGARPVFADIDPDTFNLDPAAAERAITPRTRVIMPVHQVGLPADMDRFLELGQRYGLAIVEDAACAIGAKYKGRPVGSLGPLSCFSLHPRKVITTGEGGMIAVHDSHLADRMRRLRAHAMDMSDLARHSAHDVIFESYPERGFNVRMTDMQAAIGLCQLEGLDLMFGQATTAGRALYRRARAASRPRAALRPAVCHSHLAVVLRPGDRAGRGRPDRVDAPIAGRRNSNPSWRDGYSPRASVRRSGSLATAHRRRSSRRPDAAAVPGPHRGAAGSCDRSPVEARGRARRLSGWLGTH